MFSLEGFVLISCTVLLVVQPGHGSEIIGGKEVEAHSLPFMALVGTPPHICGGTLINPKWVLTAAHCEELKTVSLGGHSIRKKESWKEFNVKRSIPCETYKVVNDIYYDDLMMLELETAAKQTEKVKELQLGSPPREPKTGTSCLTAGWGWTIKNVTEISDVLMSVKVTVKDREECTKSYINNPRLTKAMICAGSKNAGACGGDSGGPLLCNGELVGVTSFGNRFGQAPGVYTYITKEHLSWIKKIIRTSELQE